MPNHEPHDLFEFPMSYAQERLWVIDQLDPGEATYNIPLLMRVKGVLDRTHLEHAIRQLCDRHETLRISFDQKDGEALQILWPASVLDIRHADCRQQDEQSIRDTIAKDAAEGFDLGRLPLFRLLTYQINEQEQFLLLVFHHIISDGWSLGIFFEELVVLYEAEINQLPPLPIQYPDYAIWQREKQGKSKWEDQFAFWKSQIGDVEAGTVLPGDFDRPRRPGSASGTLEFRVPATLCKKLKAASSASSNSLFVLTLTAFKILISRYANSEDVVIGIPVANRRQKELERMIGFLVNTLVLRSRISISDSFVENLERVRITTLNALANQEYPFDQLVANLQRERRTDFTPFFQVMFTMPPEISRPELEHLEIFPEKLPLSQTKFDLTFNLTDAEGGLDGLIEYRRDLFLPATISTIKEGFLLLLEAVAAAPEEPLQKLAWLQAARAETEQSFNQTEASFPEDKCLHTLFESVVQTHPDRIAIHDNESPISFFELNQWSNQIARQLLSSKISLGDTVAVFMAPQAAMIATLLGILKAGGNYLPVDVTLPQERAEFILEDGQAKVVVMVKDSIAPPLTSGATFLQVDREVPGTFGSEGGNPDIDVKPEDTAYIIYTSGSTGQPKGCELAHRGVVNRIDWMWKQYDFGPTDIILQKTALSFDVSVWEIFLPLCFGAGMVIADAEDRRDPQRIVDLVDQFGITTLHFVPSMLKAFLGYVAGKKIPALPGSRHVFVSGEALPLSTARKFFACSSAKLHNLYGPTEASVDVSYFEVTPETPKILIGKPISNIQLYILDEEQRQLPVGAIGEICIAGIGLAKGYINRSDLTQNRFLPNPFQAGAKLYRTGDLGRWNHNGEVEFLGRNDSQVKVRGFRVEIQEIQLVLERYPEAEAAYVRVDKYQDDLSITAIVVPAVGAAGKLKERLAKNESGDALRNDSRQWINDLKAHCASVLPPYMIPENFILTHEIPVTLSGKADHKRLSALQVASAPANGHIAETLSDKGRALGRIWEKILGKSGIRAKDSFFELGGHSLKAIHLISTIFREMEIELPLHSVFENPTLGQMARLIEGRKPEDQARIEPGPPPESVALSPAQMRLWVLSKYQNGDTAYNIPLAFHLKGPLEEGKLKEAVEALWKRHDILRVTIREEFGQPQMHLHPFRVEDVPISFQDLNGRPDPAADARKMVNTEAQKPFNFERGPLARIVVIKLTPESRIVLLNFHHIISDGWSLRVAFREICNQLLAESENDCPPRPFQFYDFSNSIQANEAELLTMKAYWQNRFRHGLTPTGFKLDFPRPKYQSFAGAVLQGSFSKEETKNLQALALDGGGTLFMVLLTLVNVLLNKYTGQSRFTIGTAVALREHPALENQIGLYLNTIALHQEVQSNWQLGDLFQKVIAATIADYRHRQYPFERLVQDLKPEKNPGRHPVFQVFLLLDEEGNSDQQNSLANAGIKAEPFPITYNSSKFDLSFSFRLEKGVLTLDLEYDASLFRPSSIEKMIGHFKQVGRIMGESPQLRIADFSILTEEEVSEISRWQACPTPSGTDPDFLSMFRSLARQQPNALALRAGHKEINYRDLYQITDRLAQWLQSTHKIKKGSRIALLLKRDEWMLISILAILKLKAVFIPIDLTYPVDRIAFILDEAKPAAVLSSRILPDQIPTISFPSILLADFDPEAVQDAYFPAESTEPDDMAYVLFTSGSTGLPKGVAMSQGNLNNFLHWAKAEFRDSNFSSVYAVTSYCFDLSVFELLFPLVAGKSVWILQSAVEVSSVIDTDMRMLLNTVPSIVREMLRSDGIPQNVTVLNLAGEAIDLELGADLAGLTGVEVRNLYGPSEATTYATCYNFSHHQGPVPIGVPIANGNVQILDQDQNPVPAGIPGELYISGPLVALGYLNKPELTAERFKIPGAGKSRTYRTGDIGYWREDGQIMFLGREDNQVKIRGFRIETGEIENTLIRHPEIDQAVVLTRKDALGSLEMVGAVTGKNLPEQQALRNWLRERLPAYFIPAHWIFLDSFPLNANGKIDRKAILSLPVAGEQARANETSPQSDMEKKVAEIWKELLGLPRIGREANFFDLGGNSILALRFIGILEKETGTRLEPQVMLMETLSEIAEKAASMSATEKPASKSWFKGRGKNKNK